MRLAGLDGGVDISFVTADDRALRGYLLRAKDPSALLPGAGAKGYLLILQGNAILAGQILREFLRSSLVAGTRRFLWPCPEKWWSEPSNEAPPS